VHAVTVRRADTSDASALAELAARTFTQAFAAQNRPEDIALHLARAYGVTQQTAELADPAMTTLVAEQDVALVAFAQLRVGPAPSSVRGVHPVELARFYVDQAWHGKRVAQQLMQAAEDEALRRGASPLWLGVWEHNPRAIAFYRTCGFVPVGTHVFTVGEDPQTDIVMERFVGNS
jgi:diamine N-acetyltransferase